MRAGRVLAKDGADVSETISAPQPASQIIGVGETFDFELDLPPGRQVLWLEVRSPGGRWLAQGRIVVR